MACQNKAVIIRTTTAKREKYQPKEDLKATGKGTWSFAPILPLRTRGTVQTRLPKMIQYTDSRLQDMSLGLRFEWEYSPSQPHGDD
jgi:hypothetical protein